MRKAARAIIIEDGKILLMHRNKYGSQYFTLVGGQAKEGESMEQTLVREVFEETRLQVTECHLTFTEEHPAPHNDQYIFVCKVAPHGEVAIHEASEEAHMNQYAANTHQPLWVSLDSFATRPFRTIQLQEAIVRGAKKGFPKQPVHLSDANSSQRTLLRRIFKR